MQTEKSSSPTWSPRRWIICLVGAHVVVGSLLGAITASASAASVVSLMAIPFFGLILSQMSLLGIWVGSGANPWGTRFIGGLVGVTYLGLLIGIDDPNFEIILLIAFATIATAAVLLVFRFFGPRIRLNADECERTTGMQFSILHVMLLTLVAACLLTLAKWRQPSLDLYFWPYRAMLSVPFVAIGLVAAWAILPPRHPFPGVVVLFAVAGSIGFAFDLLEYAAGRGFGIWAMTFTLAEAFSLTVSLLVVRACGYRLRRRSARQPQADA